jgi:hypothetical protein
MSLGGKMGKEMRDVAELGRLVADAAGERMCIHRR